MVKQVILICWPNYRKLLEKGEATWRSWNPAEKLRFAETSPRCCTVAAQRARRVTRAFAFASRFTCKTQLFQSGRCWVRTSDLCRVKAALSR